MTFLESMPIIGAVSPIAFGGFTIWWFLRDRATREAVRNAVIDERVSQIPDMIDSALLRWQVPFKADLNGTYMRTPLIEAHLKGISERVDAVHYEVDKIKNEIRSSVRHEVRNVLQGHFVALPPPSTLVIDRQFPVPSPSPPPA